jgi:uncharacterized iron-regulated membrane protein
MPTSLSPPDGAQGVWRAAGVDRSAPTRRFDLVLDAYDGRVLYRAGWDAQTAFGKATAVGIPFHRGEFRLWNQLLLFLFGCARCCPCWQSRRPRCWGASGCCGSARRPRKSVALLHGP